VPKLGACATISGLILLVLLTLPRLAHRPQPRRDHDEVIADVAAPAASHWLGGVAEFSV
jgi:hypothetical protein